MVKCKMAKQFFTISPFYNFAICFVASTGLIISIIHITPKDFNRVFLTDNQVVINILAFFSGEFWDVK
jgi:hypothetical protein